MADDNEQTNMAESLLATPNLAGALESEQFRRFLDQIPMAIVVSQIKTPETIVYANPEFEKLFGQSVADISGQSWRVLRGVDHGNPAERTLGEAVTDLTEYVGTFKIDRPGGETVTVDAYSNVIEDDDGTPCYRLAALVDVSAHRQERQDELEQQVRERDTLLREVQHRVKNNLQMITALIRIEARNAQAGMDTAPFDRLAGRIESIQLLYSLLSDQDHSKELDLGVYLSKIAASVLGMHATDGIRLDLKVDACPVSVNVALPTGLVVNELLTNSFKHAFAGRDGGTIILHSLADEKHCRVIVADDGSGLPEGAVWPKRGKLSAAIVQTLRENAKASLDIASAPGRGMSVTISFSRELATAA
jgi:PAS domain S-box-containing protein